MSAPSRSVSEALVYAGKIWIAGLAAAVLVPLALVAAVLDLLHLTGAERLVPRVIRASARLEAAIDVHGDWTDIRVRDRAPA